MLAAFTQLALLALSARAQAQVPIHVRGKVTQAGAPVAGAVVTLVGKVRSDTTDSQGAFSITGNATSLSPADPARAGKFRFADGLLELALTEPADAGIELFDVTGNLIDRRVIRNAEAGIHRLDVAPLSREPRLLFIRASIGEETRIWRYHSLHPAPHGTGSRRKPDPAAGGDALAKAAAPVDSLRVVKPGHPVQVLAIESYDTTVDISLGSGTGPGRFVEDAGYDCPATAPSGSNGGSATVLPDPFTRWNGAQVKTLEDWRCRRRELLVEIEKRILGAKAPPPALQGGAVTGTLSKTAYTVKVTTSEGQTSFSGTVSVPSTGTAPYPAVIVIGGFNSLNKDVMAGEGVATLSYDNNAIAAETAGNFTRGKYFDANPSLKGNTGALMAWAWGVSRLIDLIEKNPGVIDPAKIAVHGCSRLGKAAFVIGAFDQRIALGLPLEPGTGGPAPLRALPSLGGQTLASANGEASWFGPMAKDYTASMAVDMSDVAALYAPRGLLLMDNAHIAHLSYKANYLGVAAARVVYQAMGREDAAWYLGSSANGSHCADRAEYGDELKAMIRKFLKGDAGAITGGLDKHANHGNINVEAWMGGWKKGTFSQ